MLKAIWTMSVCFTLIVIAGGCGKSSSPANVAASSSTAAGSAATSKALLAAEPPDAKPVGDVRASAKDADDVTILGRIGGDANPWVDGRAAFTIVDPKLVPCKPDEGCPTPWDYCCSTDQLPANRALIKVVDDTGSVVEEDARKLLGVKELQTVVVRGKAKRDDAGNLTVLATGVYLVPDKK